MRDYLWGLLAALAIAGLLVATSFIQEWINPDLDESGYRVSTSAPSDPNYLDHDYWSTVARDTKERSDSKETGVPEKGASEIILTTTAFKRNEISCKDFEIYLDKKEEEYAGEEWDSQRLEINRAIDQGDTVHFKKCGPSFDNVLPEPTPPASSDGVFLFLSFQYFNFIS